MAVFRAFPLELSWKKGSPKFDDQSSKVIVLTDSQLGEVKGMGGNIYKWNIANITKYWTSHGLLDSPGDLMI